MSNENHVKPIEHFLFHIDEFTKLAEETAEKPAPTLMEIDRALERLVRAETLEAALEINGPGQKAYDRIQLCRKKLLQLQLTSHRRLGND